MSIENKLNTIYGVKAQGLTVDDVDEPNRIVKFYISKFNVKDSDGDVLRKGVFKKSLQQRGVKSEGNRKIQHLRHHDWTKQIGVFTELAEDNYGLYAVSKLGRSDDGRNALLDYQDGIIKEHSIGFSYVKAGINKKEDEQFGEYYNVTEVNLMEGSAVTFGANEFTPTLEANKSISLEDSLDKLNVEMNVLVKALLNGKGTDERLESFSMRLKQIQQKINSLVKSKPFDKDTLIIDKPKPTKEDVQKALEDAQKEMYLKLLLK